MKARLGISSRAFIVNYGGYRGCDDRSVALLGSVAVTAVVAVAVVVAAGASAVASIILSLIHI